jgi:hypothetical protein
MRPSRKRNAFSAGVAGPAIGQKDVRFRQRAEPGHDWPEAEVRRQHADDGAGQPSMLMDCPTIAGSALSDVRHSRSLTIALPIVVLAPQRR